MSLAVAALALAALIRLQLVTINMTDQAEMNSRAVLLAEAKIDEALAQDISQPGSDSGTVQKGDRRFRWTRRVSTVAPDQAISTSSDGLRQLSVDITWKQGRHDRHVGLTTLVARQEVK